MKTKNLTNLFFLIFALAAFTTNAQKITISKWEMHRGKPAFDFVTTKWGDPTAYSQKNIPATEDTGWKSLPNGIKLEEPSTIPKYQQLDFTYFQSIIDIPKNTKPNKLTISFKFVDDGARVYIFNSKYPKGTYKNGTDFVLDTWYNARPQPARTIGNFADLLVTGKNRIVIVQFDNSAKGNHIEGVSMIADAKTIPVSNKTVKEMETVKPLAESKIIGHWTFENGSTKDLTGNFGDLTLERSVIEDGQLHVGNNQLAWSTTYNGPDIKEKTLVTWVTVLNPKQQGGTVLTVGKKVPDFDFDGIIFGEKQKNTWMAGSGDWNRTQPIGNKAKETLIGSQVKIAISFGSKNGKNEVKLYRNDVLAGTYIKGEILSLDKNQVGVIFGQRHFWNGLPSNPWVNARIEEAMIYSGVLSPEEIKKVTTVKKVTVSEFIPDLSKKNDPKWSYGYGKAGEDFTSFPPPVAYKKGSPVNIMKKSGTAFYSAAQNNSNKDWVDVKHSITFPPKSKGAIALHPGQYKNEYAKVRYSAPKEGTYKIRLTFKHLDTNFTKAKAEIWTNKDGTWSNFENINLTRTEYNANNGTITREYTFKLKKNSKVSVEIEGDGTHENDYTLVSFGVDEIK
ncbi:hypothetical protein BTO05_00895 [Winogradskyella sp. PC-19]|uniref:hypothetical protein n=1 Tax=Winogradskyella sp. PC-19 TaxID=754417 RepID=UPI000B3CDF12|nr:hypothetical protein [Winogradskyella sp. PC-19]ARV08263.1 hypothetical protein BTO05_00895 [Winogradskyella sp. PC-19]